MGILSKTFQILNNEVVNNGTAYSSEIKMQKYRSIGVTASWSGTGITGTASLEVKPHVDAPWIEVPDSSQVISGDGSFAWEFETAFYYVRAKIVETSGNNLTANVYMSAQLR